MDLSDKEVDEALHMLTDKQLAHAVGVVMKLYKMDVLVAKSFLLGVLILDLSNRIARVELPVSDEEFLDALERVRR